MTAIYERPSNASNRQRTPSPGPSRRVYDSYVPHRSENVPYRNVYRPNNYRPELSSYHPRSPSPDADPSSYRGSSWRPPDRRPLPLSPTLRRFESSDSWRHGDRFVRDHQERPDRHFRGRAGTDLSPERSPRYERQPTGIPDRHGPPLFKRETRPSERRQLMDSYRPQYDDERPRRDLPLSPPNGRPRRESESSPSRLDPDLIRLPMRPSLSAGVLSPSLITHGSPDPPWSSPVSPDAIKRISLPRSASRSSIASTHVSERKSPGVASIPQPLSIRLPAGLPAKPQAAIDALAKENRRADEYGAKPVHTSVISQTPMHAIEPEKVLKTSSFVREPATDISQHVIEASEAQAQISDVKGEPSTSMLSAVEAIVDIDDEPPMPRLEPQLSPKPSSPVGELRGSPALRGVSPPNSVFVESEHSKTVTLGRTSSTKELDKSALEIPPATHSPTSSPDPSRETDASRGDLLAHSTQLRPEDIPSLSSAQSMKEALRVIVMTRLLRDHQSREARINPVLMANLAIAPPLEVHPTSTPGSLIDKMCTGFAHDTRLEAASKTRPLLVKYFAHRQSVIDEKKARLHEEYMTLQDRWIAQCNALNEQQRIVASEQESLPPMRATRRSMAITDAVRSDFEMEQIIASLGNDDATDPNHLSIRNLARIPEMISSVKGKVDTVFDDMNYLVQNPAEYYAPDTGINDWTDEEKKVFMEKFGAHPKQFGLIAEFLPNKTAAQCVTYYYLHKKLFIDFRKVVSQYAPNKRRRRGMGRKKGNGLLADIAMHDLEVHRGLGSASSSTSTPAARAPRGRRSINAISALKPPSSRRNPVQLEETPTSTPTPEPELKSRKRRAPSGTATPVSFNPSPMSVPLLASTPLRISTPSLSQYHSVSTQPRFHSTFSEATAIVDEEDTPEQGSRPVKRARRSRKIKSAVIVVDEPPSPPLQSVLLPVDEPPEPASLGAGKKERVGPPTVQWSDDDKKRFLSLLSQYDTDFKQIAALMPPKTIGQVANYYRALQVPLARNSPNTVLPPDNHEPHWSTFPASETKRKRSTPPLSSPATLMTTIKSLSSLGGYDASRNTYPTPPTSSQLSCTNHASPSWNAPSLPTRVFHNSPNQSIRLGRRSDPEQYSSSPSSGSPRSHKNSHLASPANLALGASQDSLHSRPRVATSNYSASPSSHSNPVTGLPGSSYVTSPTVMPGSTVSASAAIIHSPSLPSPQLPLHQSPPQYESYPLSSADSREHATQYRQPGPQLHSHSHKRSGSSMRGWTSRSTPHAQNTGIVSYDNGRVSSPRVTAVDSRGDGRVTVPSQDNRPLPGFSWRPSSTSAAHSNPWTTDPYPQSGWRG